MLSAAQLYYFLKYAWVHKHGLEVLVFEPNAGFIPRAAAFIVTGNYIHSLSDWKCSLSYRVQPFLSYVWT